MPSVNSDGAGLTASLDCSSRACFCDLIYTFFFLPIICEAFVENWRGWGQLVTYFSGHLPMCFRDKPTLRWQENEKKRKYRVWKTLVGGLWYLSPYWLIGPLFGGRWCPKDWACSLTSQPLLMLFMVRSPSSGQGDINGSWFLRKLFHNWWRAKLLLALSSSLLFALMSAAILWVWGCKHEHKACWRQKAGR